MRPARVIDFAKKRVVSSLVPPPNSCSDPDSLFLIPWLESVTTQQVVSLYLLERRQSQVPYALLTCWLIAWSDGQRIQRYELGKGPRVMQG